MIKGRIRHQVGQPRTARVISPNDNAAGKSRLLGVGRGPRRGGTQAASRSCGAGSFFSSHRCEVEHHAWNGLARIERKIVSNLLRRASTKDCSAKLATTQRHFISRLRREAREHPEPDGITCSTVPGLVSPRSAKTAEATSASSSAIGPTGKVPNNLPSRSRPMPASDAG